jgi:hypothetical protein
MTDADTDDDDPRKRDHTLKPEWLTWDDPLPQPISVKRDEYLSLARRMIAANAIRRYREDGENGWVSYSRRMGWYAEQPDRFYWPKWFTYTYVISAVDNLEAVALLLHDKKHRGNRHWQSRFLATEKLINPDAKLIYKPIHLIVMRDEDKQNIAYERNPRVLKMSGDLDEINAYLSKQVIALHGKVLKEGDPLYAGLHCVTGATRIPLRRIFNESFYKGGRYFNDVQNIPKGERAWMTINGHPVGDYDYSAFYPGLLYALTGGACDGDPYTIPGVPREIAKPILNIVLNAKTYLSAVRAAANDLKRRGDERSQSARYDTARQIIAALKARNQPIAEFFHNDVGKVLMLHESQLLEWNMRALMKLERPFIPLHDAIMVEGQALPLLERIMADNLTEYRELLTLAGQKLRGSSD